METIQLLILAAITLAAMGGYLWSIAWAIGDAQKRGHSGCGVLVLCWLFGPLAAILWRAMRPATTLAERSPEQYNNADDALAAASRLDSLGDWDAAINLYEITAKRWPEHRKYADACIEAVRAKINQSP